MQIHRETARHIVVVDIYIEIPVIWMTRMEATLELRKLSIKLERMLGEFVHVQEEQLQTEQHGVAHEDI